MPRTARASVGGVCYHAVNRGNARAAVYHDVTDYQAFEDLMCEANERIPMRILAWCLMPNHFHLVLWPRRDGDLSRWMHWLLTTHVQRHRRRHKTSGRIWQGRFAAPPIQQDRHLLLVLRYVERNPLRAGLVGRAEDWQWSSVRSRRRDSSDLLAESPITLPDDWVEWVNEPLTGKELAAIRTSVRRGRPFGDPVWQKIAAERFDLLDTLHSRGRPRAFDGGSIAGVRRLKN